MEEDMRKIILLEIIPEWLSTELEAQLHLFPSYLQLRNRIEEITTTRPELSGSSKIHALDEVQAEIEFQDADGTLQKLERLKMVVL